MNRYVPLSVFCLLVLWVNSQTFNYPVTPIKPNLNVYFNDTIEDGYQWLEDQTSEETKKWVDDQNKLTRKLLDAIPNSTGLREQIKRNTQIEYLTPQKKGNYFFEIRTNAYGGKVAQIYFKEKFTDDWEELAVTKDLGLREDQTLQIYEFEVSKNSKYIAYEFNKDGSDWKEIKVADLEKQKSLPDHLYDVKLSKITWRGNGFYYTRYDAVSGEEKYKQQSVNGKLYYHKLGTDQKEDSLVFKNSASPANIFTSIVTDDERYLIIRDQNLINKVHMYYYFDFENQNQTGLMPLTMKLNKDFSYLGSVHDSLYFLANHKGARKVVTVLPTNPGKWITKIDNIDSIASRDFFYYNSKFYELVYHNLQEYIVVYNNNGSITDKVEFPFGAHCDFKGIDKRNNQLLFSYGSILHPPVYAAMNLSNNKFELLEKARISYEVGSFELKKAYYQSDTALVPLMLLYKKGLNLTGDNPALIEYYGGYGIISSHGYDPGVISFVENGGVYAYAMIRGGGEKGYYWHIDGKLNNRRNGINDIVNAAEYLIKQKFTNPSKIAITGASHGGYMTALAVLKRPDLFAVAVPKVGVYDMLRFEKFTVGVFHKYEYGSTSNAVAYKTLKAYSPYHLVDKNARYPAMMFMTSDYDDRVPPLHSYKMVAKLQGIPGKENPVLLRVEKNAGHNGARSYEKYIEEETDFYLFIYKYMNLKKYN